MVGLISRLAGQAWVHVAVAFVLMGSWAIFANWAHEMPRVLVAGLVQGTISATITYGLKRLLDSLRNALPRNKGWWMPPLLTCTGSLMLLIGIHLAAGTPELIRTISVPFGVATLYAVTYNLVMWKKGPRP